MAQRAPAAAILAMLLLPGPARAAHPLEKYLALALHESLPVQAAELDLDEAEVQLGTAWFSFLPIPVLESSVTRLDRAPTLSIDTAALGLPFTFPEISLTDQNLYRLAGKLAVPIFTGGKRVAYLAAAKHGVAARQRALDATQQGIVFGVVAAYVQLLQAQHAVAVLAELVESDAQLVHVAHARVAAQVGIDLDVSVAETMAADSERKLVMGKSEARQKQHAFNDLVGLPLGGPVELADLTFDEQFAPKVEQLLAGVRRRPELTAVMEASAVQQELTQVTLADSLPTLAVLGEGGYKGGELGYRDGDTYWQVTAALQWNLMLDGTAWQQLAESRLKAQRAALEVTRARRRMELELSQAYQQFTDTNTILTTAQKGVRTAAAGVRNARAAYEAGVVQMGTVVDASRRLAEAKEGYLKAYYARVLTEVQLRYQGGLPPLAPANLSAEQPFSTAALEAP